MGTLPIEDMALDDYEACFFRDDAEEFYEDSLSKDLFKKFELLTPPQSPRHEPDPPDLQTSVDKNLLMVSHMLDKDTDSENESVPTFEFLDDCLNLASNLIQDCMWSGPCLAAAGLISPDAVKKKHIKVTERRGSSESKPGQTMTNGDIKCVDPAAVFPYPVNVEHPKKCLEKSYSLGSIAETPSPSESEDEEEIDVVTVCAEKMARKRQAPSMQSSHTVSSQSSFTSHFAAIHNYSNTNSPPPVSYSAPQSPQSSSHHRERSHHHSYKRSRPISMPASPQPAAKRQRSLLHSTDLKRVVQRLKLNHSHSHSHSSNIGHRSGSGSLHSSDSEDCDINKRAQHNVLERKRRNDLKFSFLKLRDTVPELSKQERTPKVTILKQSADYVHSLTAQNRVLEREFERTKLRHEQLRKRLSILRRECL